MILTYCYTLSGEELVTPDYPESATTYSVIGGLTWVSVDDVGEVTFDIGGVPIGEYVINISYGGEFPGTIEIFLTIEDCEPTLLESTFSYCTGGGEFTQQLYPIGVSGTFLLVAPLTGVRLSTDGVLTIDANTCPIGNNGLNITIDGEPFKIYINILTCATPSTDTLTDCKLDPIGIVWVNQEGGRQSYWFNQPKEYEIDQNGGQTWINSDKENRYLNRGRVEYGLLVTQEFIPELHVTSINSLKNSIQAWACTDINDRATYRSIILNEDTWIFKRTNDRFFRLSFELKYSIAKTIQRQ